MLTARGTLSGTPAYLAPELYDDPDDLSPAADVFALGIIAFQLLSNKKPFREPPVLVRMRNEAVFPAPSLIRWCPDLDPELCYMVDDALSLHPALRPTAARIVDLCAKHSSK